MSRRLVRLASGMQPWARPAFRGLALALVFATAACRPSSGGSASAAPLPPGVAAPAVSLPANFWAAPTGGVAPVEETRDFWRLSPFPSDALAVADPSSPTGLRPSLPLPPSLAAPLVDLIRHAHELDGFGTFAPVTVRFNAPLDLASIRPDTLFLVDLATGRNLPVDLDGTTYPDDEHTLAQGNRKPYYEDATDTLILRPLAPLASGTRHAVVLTDGLRAANGQALSAPTGGAHAPSGQQTYVDQAAAYLGSAGLLAPATRKPVWGFCFTTQSALATMQGVAAAMADPQHPLSRGMPRVFNGFADLGNNPYRGQKHLAGTALMQDAFSGMAQITPLVAIVQPKATGWDTVLSNLSMDQLDYVAFGSITSPDLRGPDGIFRYDPATGAGPVHYETVPVAVAVPRPTKENGWARPPYPVVVFGHGNTRSRLDGLTIANRFASFGYATISLDFPGHGPGSGEAHLPQMLKDMGAGGFVKAAGARAIIGMLNQAFSLGLGTLDIMLDPIDKLVDDAFSRGLLHEIARTGRARDVDGDGVVDSGADFAPQVDIFPTRDIMRQSAVDAARLVTVIRALGVDQNGNGRLDPEEGDLDGDGAVDFGGGGVQVCYIGQSLGASVGAMLSGITDKLDAAVLNVGSGNTTQFFLRSGISAMRKGVSAQALAVPPAGLGLSERTPPYRFLYDLHQMALDASEPALYAAAWARRPNADKARLLLQTVPSDDVVPAACGVTLARSAGLVSPARQAQLVSMGVIGGQPVDVDQQIQPERWSHGALRFHPSGEHIYLIIPNYRDPNAALWTRMAQRQAGWFFKTGQVVDDRKVLNAGP